MIDHAKRATAPVPSLTNRSRVPFIDGGVVVIPLQDGRTALCDVEDFDLVKGRTWSVTNRGYVAAGAYPDGAYGGRLNLRLHKVICPQWPIIDHKDRDRLNNRRENLRPATPAQNSANTAKTPRRTSRFKGVSWSANSGRWQVSIGSGRKTHALGTFVDEEAAARTYDRAAIQLHGEYAKTNFDRAVLASTPIDVPDYTPPHAHRKLAGTSSRYRGVCKHKRIGRWQASITLAVDGKWRRKTLGYFDDEEDAARAYDKAAVERWGASAVLNFPRY